MPFRKRSRQRMRKPASALKVAKRALSKVNSLSKKTEVKTSQVFSAQTIVGDAAHAITTRISSISAGSGRDQRVGNRITGKYGHIHGSVLFNSAASTPDNQWCRIAIFYDKATNETTEPTVFNSVASTDLLEGNSFVSNFNTQTRNRYKLLKVINIQRDSQLSMGQEHYFKNSFKMPSRIEYNGSTGTDESKNCVWFAAWSGDQLNSPSLFRTVRIWYTDE